MNLIKEISRKLEQIFVIEKCLKCKKEGALICKTCLREIPGPERDLPEHIYAIYEYRDEYIKKVLTDAKYRGRFSGLRVFSNVMYDAVLDIISEYFELNNYTKILIIPVPISKKRYKMRGYNQAEIIAKSIIQFNKKYELGLNIIKKIKDKTPQASIHNRKDRLKSPIGTFKIVNEEILNGAFCIIVDDITTTGGTINEMRRILIESGAQTAVGLTIAH